MKNRTKAIKYIVSVSLSILFIFLIYQIILLKKPLNYKSENLKANSKNTCASEFSTDISDNIVSLSQIWDSAKEYYPFWTSEKIKLWDDVYNNAVNKALELNSYYDYYVEMEKMVATLDDGYVTIFPNNKIKGEIGLLPYDFDYYDGHFYITAKTENSKLPLYSEVIKVNNIDTIDFLKKEIVQLVPVKTNNAYLYESIKRLMYSKLGSEINITVKTLDGKIISEKAKYEIPLSSYDKVNNAYVELPQTSRTLYKSHTFTLAELEKDIYYLGIYTFSNNDMVLEFEKNIIPLLNSCEEIIIDVRNNDGGNSENGENILQCLLGNSVKELSGYCQVKNARKMAIATNFGELDDKLIDKDLKDDLEIGLSMLDSTYLEKITPSTSENLSSKPCIKKNIKLIVLISHKSGSAVDDFAAYAHSSGKVMLIGTNTRGATGLIARTKLSNGCEFIISSQKIYTPEGVQIQNNGIAPDYIVWQTIEDLRVHKDTTLLYALEKIHEK
jgi:C-terminal processing protease CtpA/Prc